MPKTMQKRPRIDYDSVTISKNALYPYSTQAMNRQNRYELFFSFSGGGGGGGDDSPIVISYDSFPIQIRCRYEYSGELVQFGWNRTRIHYD